MGLLVACKVCSLETDTLPKMESHIFHKHANLFQIFYETRVVPDDDTGDEDYVIPGSSKTCNASSYTSESDDSEDFVLVRRNPNKKRKLADDEKRPKSITSFPTLDKKRRSIEKSKESNPNEEPAVVKIENDADDCEEPLIQEGAFGDFSSETIDEELFRDSDEIQIEKTEYLDDPKRKTICPHCQEPVERELDEHLSESALKLKGDTPLYKCQIEINLMSTKFTFLKDLLGLQFECNQCSQMVFTFNQGKKHLSDHHPETVHTFFIDEKLLIQEGNKSHCNVCTFKSNKKSNLSDHIFTKHLTSTDSYCADCHRYFTTNDALINHHKKKVTRGIDGPFCCELKSLLIFDKETNAFSCFSCKHVSSNLDEAREHQTCHFCPQEFYSCLYCKYRSEIFGKFVRHVSYMHFKAKVFKCIDCPEAYPDKKQLLAHISSSHSKPSMSPKKSKKKEEEVHPCPYCDYRSQKRQNLNRHIDSVHMGERKFSCEGCGQTFKANRGLKSHIEAFQTLSEDGCQSMSCVEMCEKISGSFSRDDQMQKFICQQCDFETVSLLVAEKHFDENFHAGKPNAKALQCEFCDHTSKNLSNMKRHIVSMHTDLGSGVHSCSNCKLRFADELHLDRHLEKFGLEEKSRKCKQPKFLLGTDIATRSVYDCSDCPYSTQSKGDFRRHYSQAHLKEGKYCCGFCDLTFPTHLALFNHILNHKIDNSSKLMCEYYLTTSSLTMGDVKVDPDTEELICPVCPYKNLTDRNMESHLNMHRIQKKSYACILCKQDFRDLARINLHFRKDHDIRGNSEINEDKKSGLILADEEEALDPLDFLQASLST